MRVFVTLKVWARWRSTLSSEGGASSSPFLKRRRESRDFFGAHGSLALSEPFSQKRIRLQFGQMIRESCFCNSIYSCGRRFILQAWQTPGSPGPRRPRAAFPKHTVLAQELKRDSLFFLLPLRWRLIRHLRSHKRLLFAATQQPARWSSFRLSSEFFSSRVTQLGLHVPQTAPGSPGSLPPAAG